MVSEEELSDVPYFSFLFIILGQKWWYTIFLNNNFMQLITFFLTCTQEGLVFFLLILYLLVFRLHVSLHLNGVNQCWAGIKKMMRTAQVFKLFSSRFSPWRPTNITTSNIGHIIHLILTPMKIGTMRWYFSKNLILK